MRAKLLEQLNPENQLLIFFSSYLQDLFSLIRNLKDTVYQVIGIEPSEPKTHFISSNIHSVLLGCNAGYEQLRRVEILLKGHLKGKMVAQAISQSVRSSRKLPHNLSSSRFSRQSSKKESQSLSKKLKVGHQSRNRAEDKGEYEIDLRLESQSRTKKYLNGQYYQTNQNDDQRKMGISKSQGQFSSRKYKTPVTPLRQNHQKSPFNLIDKIRNELVVAFNSK